MVAVLDLEINTAAFQQGLSEVDALMGRVGTSANRFGQQLDLGTRSLGSFTVNSLQAVNNLANISRSFVSLSQNTTTFAQVAGTAGVEVGLLAGNFIHLYQASQIASGGAGIGGLWALLKANPLITVIGTITLAAQAIALFTSNAKAATAATEDWGKKFSDIQHQGFLDVRLAEFKTRAGVGSPEDAVSARIKTTEAYLSGVLQQGESYFDQARRVGDIFGQKFPGPQDRALTRSEILAAGSDRLGDLYQERDYYRRLAQTRGRDQTFLGDVENTNSLTTLSGQALARAQAVNAYTRGTAATDPALAKYIGDSAAWQYSFSAIRQGADEATEAFLTAAAGARNLSSALQAGVQAIISTLLQNGIRAIGSGVGNLAANIFAGPAPASPRGL